MSKFMVKRNIITKAMLNAVKTYKQGSTEYTHARDLLMALEASRSADDGTSVGLDLNDASFVGYNMEKL